MSSQVKIKHETHTPVLPSPIFDPHICKMERSKIDQHILLAGTFYLGCVWTKTLRLGENCSETEANQ